MRETWKTVNNVISRTQKQSQIDQFKGNSGVIITDPNKIFNEFNDFFVNIDPNYLQRFNVGPTGKQYSNKRSIFMNKRQ